MSTELHHTEAHSLDKTDLPDGPSGREGYITGRWIARLEDQTRRFPRESLLMSYLLGALLQSFPGRDGCQSSLTWRCGWFVPSFLALRLGDSIS